MRVQVTREDIEGAGGSALDNPVARALLREAGGDWLVSPSQTAYEMMPPYRDVALGDEVSAILANYLRTGTMQPFEFEFTLSVPHAANPAHQDAAYPDVTSPSGTTADRCRPSLQAGRL